MKSGINFDAIPHSTVLHNVSLAFHEYLQNLGGTSDLYDYCKRDLDEAFKILKDKYNDKSNPTLRDFLNIPHNIDNIILYVEDITGKTHGPVYFVTDKNKEWILTSYGDASVNHYYIYDNSSGYGRADGVLSNSQMLIEIRAEIKHMER